MMKHQYRVVWRVDMRTSKLFVDFGHDGFNESGKSPTSPRVDLYIYPRGIYNSKRGKRTREFQ